MISAPISGETPTVVASPTPRTGFGRHVLANVSFTLGSIWGFAGAFKVLFGIRVGLPGLPPLGLERIQPTSAFLTALGFFAVGALLARSARVSTKRDHSTA